MSSVYKGPTFTVASGQTTSDIIPARGGYEGADFGILILSPTTLAEAGKIEVTDAQPPIAGSTWRTLQSDAGVDLAIPAAGKAILYDGPQYATGVRIVLGGAAGAERKFATSLIGV